MDESSSSTTETCPACSTPFTDLTKACSLCVSRPEKNRDSQGEEGWLSGGLIFGCMLAVLGMAILAVLLVGDGQGQTYSYIIALSLIGIGFRLATKH